MVHIHLLVPLSLITKKSIIWQKEIENTNISLYKKNNNKKKQKPKKQFWQILKKQQGV